MFFFTLPSTTPRVASLQWLKESPNGLQSDARVYIDGSALDPTMKEITQVGFSIVVVGHDGELLGVGLGTPPPWIHDSAGAETWGFYSVLALNAHVPHV